MNVVQHAVHVELPWNAFAQLAICYTSWTIYTQDNTAEDKNQGLHV